MPRLLIFAACLAALVAALWLVVRALDPGPGDWPVSDHFDGQRFSMPGGGQVAGKSLGDLWRWQRERQAAEWPAYVPVAPVVPEARVQGGRIAATMVGHATVLLQTEGLNILTDPIWSERASPFSVAGPKRVTEPGIRFADLPKIDLVLVSHGHWDHLDLPTLKRLWARDRPLILVPLGHGAMLAKAGVTAREMDWGDRMAVGPLKAGPVPVYHWTSRWFTDRNRALWAGWTLETPHGLIYFAGDSGYGDGSLFRDVKARAEGLGKPVRLALLPVGAYEPRWFMADQHMNPAEAVKAFADLGATQALGLHWGTFQLTDEAREAPLVALRAALDEANVPELSFPALAPGEVLRMDVPPAP